MSLLEIEAAKIVWLASYPKSGNTWMRILLANYLSETDEPVDINSIDNGAMASRRQWFDEWSGVEASALDNNVIDCLRPNVYRCINQSLLDSPIPFFIKTHDAWKKTTNNDSLFPADITRAVVYIIRNPLDLAASCASHFGITIEDAAQMLCNENCAIANISGALSNQLRQHLGSWSLHVQSWIDKSGLNVCIIRYEDLKRDPVKTFEQVLRRCGIDIDRDLIEKAVRYSDFSELRKQETISGFRERAMLSSDPFFRKGECGGWKQELDKESVRKIVNMHGSTMERFGYETSPLAD